MAIGSSLSPAFPLGSRLNGLGHLEVGGCDAIELAKEFGTPAYVVAEDDLRARSRSFLAAAQNTGHGDVQIVYASKAFPCTAVMEIFAEEGLWCDVASEGELHLALAAGFDPSRIVMHGNAKSHGELEMALHVGVGLVVIDNFDEISRLESLLAAQGGGPRASAQDVLIRVTPDVRGDTHEKISTGQARSKFGFSVADLPEAVDRVEAVAGLRLKGLHAHIGSQLLDLDPFRRAAAELAKLSALVTHCEVIDAGGGLGVHYTHAQESPPEIEEYVSAVVEALRNPPQAGARRLPLPDNSSGSGLPGRILIEPGRALTANGCITLYTVESVKRNLATWVAVDGGMSDNLRPMLYGARYEAHVADRFGGDTPCVLTGKHCESGDVVIAEATLDNPAQGDVVVTPATGAYCYAMASNYNGILRAPVVICKEGDARLAVRRDTLADLTWRDVR